jgi:hypothetical protein
MNSMIVYSNQILFIAHKIINYNGINEFLIGVTIALDSDMVDKNQMRYLNAHATGIIHLCFSLCEIFVNFHQWVLCSIH